MKLYWWIWYPLCNGHETRWNKSVCDIASINFFEYNISWTIKILFSVYSFFISFGFISNPEYLDFYALISSKGEVNCFSNQNISRGLYSFYLIFHCGLYIRAVSITYIRDSILHTIYILNKEILQFLSLKSALYNQERFPIKNGL